jgi:cobalt-zinc-cadmium efflux system protein
MNQDEPDRQGRRSEHAVHAVSSTRRGLFWSLLLTASFFVVELVVGLAIGSVAVVADAAHNFSAAAGVGIALLATIFASKPPTPQRTYGFLKLEMFAAWINGFLLLLMAYLIARMGITKLLNPEAVTTLPMMILAIVGLIVGGVPAVMLFKKQKTDINVRGAFWHVMETVFGSAAVLFAALLIRYAGWLAADAILGMLLVPILVVAGWGIVKASTRGLLDLTPRHIDLVQIKDGIETLPGVVNGHHMHAWSLTTGKDLFSAHVKVSAEVDRQRLLADITKMLREEHDIYFSTLQLETECDNESAAEIAFV